MHRTLAVTLVVLSASLAGCASDLEARFPQADEVEHVGVNTGTYEAEPGDNHTVTVTSSRALNPGNATFERIVEHALPLLEDVDEDSLQQARIEWDSHTPGNGQPHVDLFFEDETPLRWDAREPIEPAFVESMRIILEPANGTQPIVAVENGNGWHWWRTDASVAPIRQAAEPVFETVKEEDRDRQPVQVKRPGDANASQPGEHRGPACQAEGYDEDETAFLRLNVTGLGNRTLRPPNVSHLHDPGAFSLDRANRTVHVEERPSDRRVHVVALLDVEHAPDRLVLGTCRSVELDLADVEAAGLGASARGGYLYVGHDHPGCAFSASVPGASGEGWLTTEAEADQPLYVRYTDEGEAGCPGARFVYHYTTGWTLQAERSR